VGTSPIGGRSSPASRPASPVPPAWTPDASPVSPSARLQDVGPAGLGLIKPPPALELGSVKLAEVAPQVAHDTSEFKRLAEGCAAKTMVQALVWGPAVSATEMKVKLGELQKRSESLGRSLQAVAPNDLGANAAETTRKLTEWRDAAETLSDEVTKVYGDTHPLHFSARAAYSDVNSAATRAFVQLAHNKLGDEGLNEAAASVLGDAPPAAQRLAAHFAPHRAPEPPR
jgi:hypothetical protein